jgi:hypothetical protein
MCRCSWLYQATNLLAHSCASCRLATFLLLNDWVDQLVKLIRDEINAMRLNR